MSDSQGGRREPATSSRAEEAIIATSTLSDLPSELILHIASLLELEDLLALRKSQKFIYSVTQDKLLWRGILRDLRLPLPRVLKSRNLDNLSYPELENAVLRSHMAERQWLKRRYPSLILFAGDKHSRVRLLNILDDRWVIIIPEKHPPAIWDTRENPPKSYKLSESMLHAFQGETIDTAAAIDPHQGDIIIGRKVRQTPQILRAHLVEPGNDSFQLTACTAINAGHLNPWIVALEPSRNVIIMGIPGIGFQISDWIRSRTVQITSGLNGDHVSTPLLGLRLVGSHILLFRIMWIELLPIPPFTSPDGQPTPENDPSIYRFHLNYPNGRFASASLSEPQPNPESSDDSRIVYALVHEAATGFFYFRVTIYNPEYAPSGPGVRMNVDLVGVYEVGKPQMGRGEELGRRLALRSWLGPEGKRGVWIERPLSILMDFVVAVSFDQSSPAAVPVESGDNLRELYKIAPRIASTGEIFIAEAGSIYDEVVQCGLSEATGKIVLGMRNSRIVLL